MSTKTKATQQETKAATENDRSRAASSGQPRTKKERLEKLLRRKAGASVETLQKEFGWQPHTVRAAISGLRKAGVEVSREAGRKGSMYRIVGGPTGQ